MCVCVCGGGGHLFQLNRNDRPETKPFFRADAGAQPLFKSGRHFDGTACGGWVVTDTRGVCMQLNANAVDLGDAEIPSVVPFAWQRLVVRPQVLNRDRLFLRLDAFCVHMCGHLGTFAFRSAALGLCL